MKKIKVFIACVFLIHSLCLFSQSTGKALEVYNLINEARSNPQAFLAKYKEEINTYKPQLIPLLEKSKSVKLVIWDKDLALNCKQTIDGSLNPIYAGKNKMCGFSSGNGSGYYNSTALYFVCDSYTHLLDEDDAYFGFYINSKGYAFIWGKSCETKKHEFEWNVTIDSSLVDFKLINTAANEPGLNAMDKEMIKELNFVRQYPQVYAGIVARYLVDKSNRNGLSKATYDAGNELIEELKVMQPASLLLPNRCLYDAAKKHGEDCKRRGFSDHTGSDGSSPFTRISKFCDGLSGNENIVGGRKNARALVIQLLIDSGISSRGHRYNMLNPEWSYVGCYGYEGGGMYNYIQNFASSGKK
ncbi:MAG: hypothetical protein H3C31_06405 [Brumimicrobium sp.]|nr:hypothetical protein [Brumimicrobium sp.]